MRRPKQPGKSGGAGKEERSPPGGRARKRLEQFNLQRGLPAPFPSSGGKDTKRTEKPSRAKTPTKK
jgi:hypothetical protein